jgi:hypothetical protein
MMIPINAYENMNNLKIDNVNFEWLLILCLYIIQKHYKCDNPNCPPIHAFTPPNNIGFITIATIAPTTYVRSWA